MDVTPGLRRIPPADLDDVGEETGLIERIRTEIDASGPMTFARFMELALYDPDAGYYRAAAARPGRAGDFLTAPEAHPIFGWSLAVQLEEVWQLLGRPARFVVREHGSGTGALARATLDGLRRTGSAFLAAIAWQPVEIDPRRTEAFERTLGEAGLGDRVLPAGNEPVVGVVLANEVLDALPVHRLVVRSGRLREILVGTSPDGRLVDVETDPTTDRLTDRLAVDGIVLAEGQRAEVCLVLDGWLVAAAGALERGLLLLIDYGHPARQLYDPVLRHDGTLRAYLRHTVHDDPFRHVGRQDLTAHVDITAVERSAAAAGLDPIGISTQAEFLAALGAGELLRSLQDEPDMTIQAYLEARAALGRMIDPTAMGRFRVMVFGRALPTGASLRGLRPLAARGDPPGRT